MSTNKQHKSASSANENSSEAMTLEEIATKADERKILGREKIKFDPNIIAFLAICFGGLIIINTVLYFLISGKPDYQFPLESDEFQTAIDARSPRADTRPAATPESEWESESESKAEQPNTAQAEVAIAEQDLAETDTERSPETVIAPSEILIAPAETPVSQPEASIAEPDLSKNLAPKQIQVPEPAMATTAGDLSASQTSADESRVVDAPSVPELAEQNQGNAKIDVPYETVISVGAALTDWAAAWSAKDVDGYLSHYSPNFVSEAGLDIDQWRAQRALRLTKPEWIHVVISKLRIEVIEHGARAELLQEYNASNYADKETKVMIFEQIDGDWKILQELATAYQES